MTGFFSVFFGFFAAVSLAAGYRGGAAAQTFRTERREKEEEGGEEDVKHGERTSCDREEMTFPSVENI